ncbi:MAG: DUF4350 domain-containing protein [Actinomycetia bacterium]|nr:DUF4350 domain-containing protein [Actinomycetes bacterium]
MSRRSLFWVVLAVILFGVAIITSGRRNETGRPLDPESTGGFGTLALIDLVETFGAEVDFGLPGSDTTTVLVLIDQLTPTQRQELNEWIGNGGTLVITDPSSSLAPDLVDPSVGVQDSIHSGACTIPGLEGLTLEANAFLLYEIDESVDRCFTDGDGAYLHVRQVGDGRVIAIGGGLALVNQNLDEADNAVLAVETLLSNPADSSAISVLFDPVLTPGSKTLSDLIPTSARWTGIQLLVAFGLYVVWRSRRFGRPVAEPQPVELPGSLLVRAAAELQRRTGGHGRADQILRTDFDRQLRRRLKVSPELPVDELISMISEATGHDRAIVARALIAPRANTRQDLIDLMAAIDAINTALADDDLQPVGGPT